MKRIAFIFTHGPHGSATGREGLDALLATSALTSNIGVFFISDGVLQLLPQQQPEIIRARNYIATFGILSLYDIEKCYICETSMRQRGISATTQWVLDTEVLSLTDLTCQLKTYDVVLTF